MSEETSEGRHGPGEWQLRHPYGWRTALLLLVVVVLLAVSARRTEVDRGVVKTFEGIGDGLGLVEGSEVAAGWRRFRASAFPLVFEERTEVARIEGFDRARLPLWSRVVEEPQREYDAVTRQWRTTGKTEVLVQPVGYLFLVVGKMLETLEIAVWGTLLALVIAVPLGFFGARQFSGNRVFYGLSRGVCSFTRAVPELISAMFFVLMYGFGAVPGVLALGIHASGFLGKFFADDIENIDRGPQEALASTGASRVKVLRFAVLPQVLPQFLAYMQYILERNFRTATVLGIVGAGGIGMELKGRWDMSDFGHVSTILLVIFLTVFLLERATQYVRARIIQ